MTQKERTRKGILWMLCSLGSYGFALLQPSIGAKLHISDDYIAFAIMVWIWLVPSVPAFMGASRNRMYLMKF